MQFTLTGQGTTSTQSVQSGNHGNSEKTAIYISLAFVSTILAVVWILYFMDVIHNKCCSNADSV